MVTDSRFEILQCAEVLQQLLNKVAGVYGLIAVLTGAGGSFAQLSLYIYSVLALLALAWGLRVVQEVCQPVRSTAHPLILSSTRRIPKRHFILLTYFSPTISSLLLGLSSLLLSGGCGRRMMDAAKRILLPNTP